MAEARTIRRGGSLFRLAQKELRETLRDRRTIITLVAMPLIVYPILSLVLKTFLISSLGMGSDNNLIRYRFLVLSDLTNPSSDSRAIEILRNSIATEWDAANPPAVPLNEGAAGSTNSEADRPTEKNKPENGAGQDSLETESESLKAGTKPGINGPGAGSAGTALVARFQDHIWDEAQVGTLADPSDPVRLGTHEVVIVLKNERKRPLRWSATIFYSEEDNLSYSAAMYLRERLTNFNLRVLQQTLKMSRIDSTMVVDSKTEKVQLPPAKPQFTALIPLVLVLMTITGAVYPAIDLTAGERERGTLETLIAAPLPRIRVLIAKMIAVITVAIFTATLNVLGMVITIWAFQLEHLLFGEQGLTIAMGLKIFLLLSLFATFFAALLLVVTSFARSFKEAQAYLIPIILMSMAPGLITLTPGMKLEGPLAVCPMVNLLLLSRDVLDGQVSIVPAIVAVFSTVIYSILAIAAAASIFGADSILYGGQSGWKELFTSPVTRSRVTPINVAMVCLFLLLPINFVAIAFLGRIAVWNGGSSVTVQLLMLSLFTFGAFWLFPTLVAWKQRVVIKSGFGINRAPIRFFAIAVILGVGLAPIVMALINGWYEFMKVFSDADAQSFQERLTQIGKEQVAKFRTTSPWVIALSMSLVPAICEEWFFRGMFQRSLLGVTRPLVAVLVSSIAFGVFHTLSGSIVAFDRLLPTTAVGLVLGMLAYKSNSILPGITMHAIHNALIIFSAYYLPENTTTIPVLWIVMSGLVGFLGIAVLTVQKPIVGAFQREN